MTVSIKNIFFKLNHLLNQKEKSKIKFVILIVLSSMILEIFGISLLVPFFLILFKKNFLENLDLPDYLNFVERIPLELILLSVVLFFIIKSILLYFFNFYNNKYIFFLKKNLSLRLLDNYYKTNYNQLLNKNLDEIVKNIISSTARCTNGFIGALINFISELFVIFGLIVFLLFINAKALILSLIIISIIGFIFFKIFKKKLKYYGSMIEDNEGEMFSILNYTFSAIKELKIFKLNQLVLSNFDKPNFILSDLRTKQANIFILPRLIFESTFIVLMLIAFFFILANRSFEANLLATVGAFSIAFIRILPSVNRIFNYYNTMIYTSPSIDLVFNEIKNTNKSIQENLIEVGKENKFKNINYEIKPSNKVILNNINFIIKKNEINCLFGKSGSGKTTLLDIMSGLLKPTDMDLVIDKEKKFKNFQWNSLGYMGQNNYYINDSLKNNICLYSNSNNFNKKLYYESIKFACLEEFFSSHSNNENIIIGYNGIKLSGGELQRLSLARMYYSNKQLLFFDEPTSALDEKTEEKIIENFNSMINNKTLVISTHQIKFKKISNNFLDLSNE